MDYRISCAETPEQRAKEQSFYGIGLTSRKNLCIHPEVSDGTRLRAPHALQNSLSSEETPVIHDAPSRFPRRRKAGSSMPGVETSRTVLCAKRAAKILAPSRCATGMRSVLCTCAVSLAVDTSRRNWENWNQVTSCLPVFGLLPTSSTVEEKRSCVRTLWYDEW